MRTLTKIEIAKIFRGPNLFTPVISEMGHINSIVYEISTSNSGKGIYGADVIGVSIRNLHGNECEYESKLFNNMEEAREYLKFIRVQELLKS